MLGGDWGLGILKGGYRGGWVLGARGIVKRDMRDRGRRVVDDIRL